MDTTEKLIGIFIGAILAGALIPVALQQVAGGIVNNTTNSVMVWKGTNTVVTASELALYAVISIAIIVAVVIAFFKQVK